MLWALNEAKLWAPGGTMGIMPEVGDYPAPFEGVQMYRRHEATEHKSIIYKPVVIIIAQGQKCVRIGDDELIYGENSYFVAGVDMPTACAMLNTSPENPYLSIAIDLDRSLIAQLAAEVPPASGKESLPSRGAMVAEMDVRLLDALLRLVELIEEPGQAFVLAPLIIKEIHYRLLATPFGSKLRAINTFGTPSNQIAHAIAWLTANFHKPIDVDELAKHANMATSTLHKHFKEVTALSPLQYQKRLRLAEAQRLMMLMGYDTAQACAEVGYESLTQFNREYKRLPTQAAEYQVKLEKKPWPCIPVLSATGNVLPEVVRVMEICAEADIIFATGHCSPDESVTLARKAKEVGVKKFVVTHANSRIWRMTKEQVMTVANLDGFIEYSYLSCTWGPGTTYPQFERRSNEDFIAYAQIVPERSFITTDMGQVGLPHPVDAMRTCIQAMQAGGVTQQDIDIMVRGNPAMLMGLEG